MEYYNGLEPEKESQQEERESAGSFHNETNYQNTSKNPVKGFIPLIIGGVLGVLALVAGIGFVLGQRAVEAQVAKQLKEDLGETTSSTSPTLNVLDDRVAGKIQEIENLINNGYLDEIKPEDVEEGIYKGLVSGLKDPYSEYFTPEEVKQWNQDTMGKYSGVGALLQKDVATGLPQIIKVFEGSPAQESGLQKGDLIYKVDDKDITGMDLHLAVTKIKGEEGSSVKLTIIRTGERQPLEIDVVRKAIEVPTVNYKMIDEEKKIGYLQIIQFEGVTLQQFKDAMAELEGAGMQELIVDLRDNPGGLLDSVVSILDYFYDKGQLLVYMEDKDGNRQEYISKDKAVWTKDVTVLVNKNSASASEIFAGAIKDTNRGKIIGENTFGKGVVQQFFMLQDGSGVKLTISSYFTPSGYNLHGKGIEVDETVSLEADSYVNGILQEDKDTQLQRALELLRSK